MNTTNEINEALDKVGKILDKAGVKYFLGVVDKADNKVYSKTDISGDEMTYLLDAALPSNDDIISLGIWVGQILARRKRNNKKTSTSQPVASNIKNTKKK